MVHFSQLLTLVAVLLTPAAHALGTTNDHDGKTTYCWHIAEPASKSKLSESDRTTKYSGSNGCPIAMTVTLANTTVEVNTPVSVSWSVVADFSGSNNVNMTQLAYGEDSSGNEAQIVHSNLHSCVYLSGCDPFYDGKELEDKTENSIANLTDNAADFQDSVQFRQSGQYTVLAHIIMPDTNASQQFAYAVYTKLTVTEAVEETEAPVTTTAAPTPATVDESDESGGLSQPAVIGIIVGGVVLVVALVVVAVVLRRRQNNHQDDISNLGYNYPPPPPYDAASDLYARNSKHGTSSDAGTGRGTGTDSWDVPGQAVGGGGYDGYTAHYPDGSSASGTSFGAAHEPRDTQGTIDGGGNGFRSTDGSSGRPKRVASDLEL